MTELDGFHLDRGDDGVATITLDVPGKFNRVSMLARDQSSARPRSIPSASSRAASGSRPPAAA